MNLIEKINQAGLCGRGGAGFPTGKKWEMVREAEGKTKYIIANGSEGELGVFKDSYILEKYSEKLVEGVLLGMETVGAEVGYIYLRRDLYALYKSKLQVLSHKLQDRKEIKIVREDGGYLGGEETTLLNAIEKKRNEPRLKPPYPTTSGLYSCPTLINNIETFYRVTEISNGKYQKKRFYSLSGMVKHKGVFELDIDLTIDEVLKQTDNYPKIEFFVQAGGGGAGPVYTQTECKKALLQGAGALIVHNLKEDTLEILQNWTDFFYKNSCGQCIPCREGFYRIKKLLSSARVSSLSFPRRRESSLQYDQKNIKKQNGLIEKKEYDLDYQLLKEILEVMADTSFCGLGQYAPEGYLNYLEKIVKK